MVYVVSFYSLRYRLMIPMPKNIILLLPMNVIKINFILKPKNFLATGLFLVK